MYALVGMPQGAEWLIILAIVILLFGSAKLPQLVRQLGKSKKIWEEEVGPGGKKSEASGELTQGSSTPPATEATQQPVQPPAQQPVQQPAQQPAQQPNTPINGRGASDGTPPTQS
jgi:sec-independent protein translocase protein TatA